MPVTHPCPECGEPIPVGETYDTGQCPECQTPLHELQQIARGDDG